SVAAWADSADRVVQLMTPSFVAPIPTSWPPSTEKRNPILVEMLRSSREPTILLAGDISRALLLIGADQSGFGKVGPLPVSAFRMHLAEGVGDALWVGGVTDATVTVSGMPRSYAYLAKVDRHGHFFWERKFGGQTQRSIEGIVGLPTGDIVVSGQDSER